MGRNNGNRRQYIYNVCKNAEDKGETGISEIYCLLYVSIILLRCQFWKAPYPEELLLFKWKGCCTDARAGKYYILIIFAKGIGNMLIYVMTF